MKSYIGDYGKIIDIDQLKIIKEYNDSLMMTPEYAKHLGKNVRETSIIIRDADKVLKPYLKSLDGLPAQYKQVGDAAVLGGSGIKRFGQIAGLAAKEIKAMAAQFLIFFAITEGISFLIKKFEELWATVRTENHVKTWAEEATAALKETQDELQSLNDEFKTTADRINELLGKGHLTLTEQEELEKLRLQNAELYTQIKLKEALADEEAKDAAEKNLDAATYAYQDLTKALDAYYQKKSQYEKGPDKQYEADMQLSDKEYYQMYGKSKANAERNAPTKTTAEQVEQSKENLLSLASELNNFIDSIDPSYLVGENLDAYNEMLDMYHKALIEADIINPLDYIQASLSEADFTDFNKQMQNMASIGKISADEVAAAFTKSFPEVKQIMLDYGYTEENWAEALAEHIKAISETTQKVTEELYKVKDATEELSNLESNINSLSDAYYEFIDNNGKVSASTLDSIAEAFSTLGDQEALKNFINVIGDSTSSVDELNSALNELVSAYMQEEATLGNLTEANRELYESQLKRLGVANSEEVVTYNLAVATLKALSAKRNLTESEKEQAAAARKTIAELDSEGNELSTLATNFLDAAAQADLLKIQQDGITQSNFAAVLATHSTALLAVAQAAGLAVDQLEAYLRAIEFKEKYESAIKAGRMPSYNVSSAYKEAVGVIEQNQKEVDKLKDLLFGGVNVNYTPSRTKDKSSSGGDKKTDAERRKEEYDKQKALLDNQLERNLISYNLYYKKLVKLGNKYLKGDKENMREHYADLAGIRRNAYDHYQTLLDNQLASGTISQQQYFLKSNELAKKWYDGRKSNEEDLKDAVEKIHEQILSSWEDKISKQEKAIERMNLDKTWKPGQTELSLWEKQLEQLKDDYINNLFIDDDEYWDLYYEILDKIKDAKKDEWERQLDQLEEQSDGIQDLIDMVDEMLRKRIEEQIDLLEEQKSLFSDIIDQKKESLDLTRQELSYQRELDEMNKDLADLQMRASVLALDDSREGRAAYQKVLEEIRQKQQDIADKQADYTYDATTNALDEADKKYQDAIQKKIDELNEMTENQGDWLQYVYKYIETTDPSSLFKQLYDYNYKYGTGMSSTVDEIKNKSQDLLDSFNSNIPKILEYLQSQQTSIQSAIDNLGGETAGEGLSENYKERINSSLNKQVQASATQNNTDAQNRTLVTKLKDEAGLTTWYDEKNKVIYYGAEGDRRVTAGAYNIIESMRNLNDTGGTRKEKEAEMNKLLTTLKKKWSYTKAELKWNKDEAHLWKTPTMQVFHTGIKQGFVSGGSTYTPVTAKQNEVLALLQKGELVFNKSDEYDLLRKLQVLDTLTTSLKKMQLDSINQITNTSGDIYVTVEAPITVSGATNDEMMRQLDKFRKNLKEDTLTAVTDGLKKRGYKSPANGLRSK